MKSLQCVLGFDPGSRRIGVAVGQTLTGGASPLSSVAVRQNKPDWEALARFIREWQPDALVVGLPLRADGSDSESTKNARRFSRQLHGRFGLPVYLVDEYLSSRAARERTDGELHSVAAQIILETWLNHRESLT